MQIDRLMKILDYSKKNQNEICSYVRKFISFSAMDLDNDLLNILQIVRESFSKKGYWVIEIPFYDQELGALTYKGNGMGYVVVNTSLPKVNANFALAHEVFHVFFQNEEFVSKVEFANNNYSDDENEFAANLFAGMLLMPEVGFRKMFRKFFEDSDRNEIDTVIRLMAYYEVPYMSVLIRCYELELLNLSPATNSLLKLSSGQIAERITELWLNEDILKPSNRDDYRRLETIVQKYGNDYIELQYTNTRNLQKILANMRRIYNEIKEGN